MNTKEFEYKLAAIYEKDLFDLVIVNFSFASLRM